MQQRWPDRLWIVRHGESAGNVARDAAQATGLARIAIEGRDVDVPLSRLGEVQSEALGRWFASQPETLRPEVVMSSPYLRAQMTGELIRRAGGLAMSDGRALLPMSGFEKKNLGCSIALQRRASRNGRTRSQELFTTTTAR